MFVLHITLATRTARRFRSISAVFVMASCLLSFDSFDIHQMVQSLNDGENESNGSKICLLLLTSRTKRGKALFYFIMLKKRCVTSSKLCRRAEMILKRRKRNSPSTSTPKRMSSMIFTIFGKPNRIHGESMNAYHSRLHQLASTCEFAN